MANCRIIVLNYNGRELMEKCLPSIIAAAAKAKSPAAVTVLDNRSSDDSEAWLRKTYGQVEWVSAPENRIFCSYNAVAASVSEDIVILLNNDIKVEEDFIGPLVRTLDENPEAFFAAPRALNFETGEYEGSLSKMELRWGLLWGTARFPGHEEKIFKPGLSMQCGFGAFRRKFLVELGGFDDLYLPGTVEDADICFRAWRRGWKGYYCPESVVHHIGQASFKKAFGDSGIRRMNRRNLYLFMWKNIRDPLLMLQHLVLIPVQLAKYAVKGERDFLLGFGDAARLLPRALEKRRSARAEQTLVSDRRIFAVSKGL